MEKSKGEITIFQIRNYIYYICFKMSEAKPHIDVFIAYARKDVAYLNQLRTHLKPLNRDKTIKIWYDGEIAPGTVWEEQIKANLKNADIILLLVSAHSLASDYFHDKEMTNALKRHKAEKTIVIPVILSDCTWEFTDLRHLQALPNDGKPIKNWEDESSAYANIVRGLYKSIVVVKQRQLDGVNKAETNELKRQGYTQPLETRKWEIQQFKSKREEKLTQQKAQFSKALKNKTLKYILSALGLLLLLFMGRFAWESWFGEQAEPITSTQSETPADTITSLKVIPKPIHHLIDNMVPVKGGTFEMGCSSEQNDCKGDETPAHDVRLSDFSIGKYEVTQEQWQAVTGNNPSYFKNCNQCPVENISWNDIIDFLKLLNKQTGKNFRLPTEAEWEFAARGGMGSKRFGFIGSNNLEEVSWYAGNSGQKTHPVGVKKPNELELFDMGGNVWEWCADLYQEDYYTFLQNGGVAYDPKGPEVGIYRVIRGGSYYHSLFDCLPKLRGRWHPDNRNGSGGFRLVLSAE